MGYWDYELFDNDHTLDFVDGTCGRLERIIANVGTCSTADFYNASVFIRGVKASADVANTLVPISAIELAQAFIRNYNFMKVNVPDVGFHLILEREATWIRSEVLVQHLT